MYCELDEQFMPIMCYNTYLQQRLAFAVAFVGVAECARGGGRPHAKVRSGQAAGGAELNGSSATASTAVGDNGGGGYAAVVVRLP
jgi:hypothetical protein